MFECYALKLSERGGAPGVSPVVIKPLGEGEGKE